MKKVSTAAPLSIQDIERKTKNTRLLTLQVMLLQKWCAIILLLAAVIPSTIAYAQQIPSEPVTPGAAPEAQPQMLQLETPQPQAVQPAIPPKATQPETPPPSSQEQPGTIVLNFEDADLKDVLQTIGEITGENFIIAPGVTAKITVQTSKPILTRDVFGIFESIIEVYGLSAIKAGAFYKIVPSNTARQRSIEILQGKDAKGLPSGDRIVTQVVPIEFISANDLFPILQPMLSPAGNIMNYPKANTLIIADILSNIKKILDITEILDVDTFKKMQIEVFTLKNTTTRTIQKELTDIITPLGIGQFALIPLERFNSIVVFSPSSRLIESIREWIERLDRNVSEDAAPIHFYYVKNDKAANIKALLEQIFILRPPPTGVRIEGEIRLYTYDPANALLIQATPNDYNTIMETIKKLDNQPKQVLIEALIAEVSLSDSTNFGIQWSILSGNVNAQGPNPSIIGSSALTMGTLPKPSSLSPPSGLSFLVTDSSKFFSIIQALASEGKVNILSNPHIVVKNNDKAFINVGKDIPVATQSQQTSITGTTGIIQNIEYKKTGVILTVAPQINEERGVILNIKQEVSDIAENITVGQTGFTYPSFTKRESETTVITKDGEALVIGGLIKEDKRESYTGIPLLMDIPILGYLFRYTTHSTARTELVILLIPKVMDGNAEAANITEEFKKRVEEMIKEWKIEAPLPLQGKKE